METILAFLSVLFLCIYCLSPTSILFLLLCVTLAFMLLHRRLGEHLWWRATLAAAIILWGCAVLWTTVWSRSDTQAVGLQLIPLHAYREVLSSGNPEILRSNFMNVVMFYPAGLLIHSLLPKERQWLSFLLTLLRVVCFNLTVEYLQFSRALGLAEIDDVIHNTLGAVWGYLALFPGTKRSQRERRSDLT